MSKRTFDAILGACVVVLLMLALFAASSAAAETTQDGSQNPSVPLPAEDRQIEEGPSRLAAAAWCSAKRSRNDDGAGCDAGLAAALLTREYRQGWLSGVGMIGAETVGAGVAWTLRDRSRFSVGVGAVCPYGDGGIEIQGWRVAVGATVGIR